MPNSATVTAKNGPAITDTAGVFSGLLNLNVDFKGQTFTVVDANGVPHIFELVGVTTFTYSISSGLATITIS